MQFLSFSRITYFKLENQLIVSYTLPHSPYILSSLSSMSVFLPFPQSVSLTKYCLCSCVLPCFGVTIMVSFVEGSCYGVWQNVCFWWVLASFCLFCFTFSHQLSLRPLALPNYRALLFHVHLHLSPRNKNRVSSFSFHLFWGIFSFWHRAASHFCSSKMKALNCVSSLFLSHA